MYYIDDWYGNVFGYENGELVSRRYGIETATWPTREEAEAARKEYLAKYPRLSPVWVSFDPDLE